jgi:hypothetical protein
MASADNIQTLDISEAAQRKALRVQQKKLLVDLANKEWFPTIDIKTLNTTDNYLKALKLKRKKALMNLADKAWFPTKKPSRPPDNELGINCMDHWGRQIVLQSRIIKSPAKKVTKRCFNRRLFETSMRQNKDALNFKVPEPRLPCYRLRDLEPSPVTSPVLTRTQS